MEQHYSPSNSSSNNSIQSPYSTAPSPFQSGNTHQQQQQLVNNNHQNNSTVVAVGSRHLNHILHQPLSSNSNPSNNPSNSNNYNQSQQQYQQQQQNYSNGNQQQQQQQQSQNSYSPSNHQPQPQHYEPQQLYPLPPQQPQPQAQAQRPQIQRTNSHPSSITPQYIQVPSPNSNLNLMRDQPPQSGQGSGSGQQPHGTGRLLSGVNNEGSSPNNNNGGSNQNMKKRKVSVGQSFNSAAGDLDEDDMAGGGGAEEDEAKGKKKRLALSCGECKRRKIKCDRNQPCSACVRRKVPLACTWEDQDPTAPQTFALSSDVRHLARRLAQLEHQFATSPILNSTNLNSIAIGGGGGLSEKAMSPLPQPILEAYPQSHQQHQLRKLSLPRSPNNHNHYGSPESTTMLNSSGGSPFRNRISSIAEVVDSNSYPHRLPSMQSHPNSSSTSHAHHQTHTYSHSLNLVSQLGGHHQSHHHLSQSTLPPHSETEDAATSLESTAFAARVPILRALKSLSLPGGSTSNREVNSNPPLLISMEEERDRRSGGEEDRIGMNRDNDIDRIEEENNREIENISRGGENLPLGGGSHSNNTSSVNSPHHTLPSSINSNSHSSSTTSSTKPSLPSSSNSSSLQIPRLQNQNQNQTNRRSYPEPTSLLTSIIAEPLSFDQDGRPRSGVRLGMDLGVGTDELNDRRREAMDRIFKVLPGEEVANFLVEKYFLEMEWDFQVIDKDAFLVELERFFQMIQQGRENFIDPLWIAVYCMILAVSLEGFWSRPTGNKNLNIFGGLNEKELQDLPSVWHDSSLRSLQLGEWGGTPRIRTIQTIILFGQYIQLSSESGQQGRFSGWAASAIRVAQRLGLHRLGHNPETMPPSDPALADGKNSHKREMCVRLFNTLILVDSLLSDSTSFRCYLLHPSQYSTCQPLNLNLSDFSRTDWRTRAPYPLHVHTDGSFEIAQCEFASQIRRALDELVLSTKPFSYAAVLEQDREFQLVLDRLPEALSERASGPESESPRLRYQRYLTHQGIYARIVRLHRPFLSRGYAPGSPYSYSTEQCVRSARLNINSNYELLRMSNSSWLTYTSTLGSAIVLFMDLFHEIDTDGHETLIQEKKAVLVKASFIFNTQVASPALRAVVEQGQRILLGLFVAEECRRETSAAHTLALVSGTTSVMESFAQVLKRISREIASENDEASASAHSSAVMLSSNSAATPINYATTPTSNPIYYPVNSNLSIPTASNPYGVSMPADFDYWDGVNGQNQGAGGMEGSPMGTTPDLALFFQTLRSEDWANASLEGMEMKGEAADGLMDQIAATW